MNQIVVRLFYRMSHFSLNVSLPSWLEAFLATAGQEFPGEEERMAFVVELSRRNVEQKSGGPFAAAVFSSSGKLIAPGVNLVVASGCSIFHAEMVALSLAQRALGTFDLGSDPNLRFELYASTEPCSMCLGAVPWSGVRRLVCAARDEDARAIGFDEGSKQKEWAKGLEQRGIAVTRDLLREEARSVLRSYADAGGLIYNGRSGQSP